ncbi:hypothetical protein ACIQAA_31050 [Neobacillus sp. NPDC093182]|uniref:hypothetical protein n=1 Tax=Neobacillus sp. NPDC093182 TaxID=3364297 RepID=UPI00380FD006
MRKKLVKRRGVDSEEKYRRDKKVYVHTKENNSLIDSGTLTPMLKRMQDQELDIRDGLERMKERFLLA